MAASTSWRFCRAQPRGLAGATPPSARPSISPPALTERRSKVIASRLHANNTPCSWPCQASSSLPSTVAGGDSSSTSATLLPAWSSGRGSRRMMACPQASSPSSDTAPAAPRRLVGVDFGTTRIGLAFGESGSCSVIKDVPCSPASKKSEVAQEVINIALERGAEALVVGIPVQPGGKLTDPDTDSHVGRKCRHFANTLALLGMKCGLEVYLYNERGTSQAAMKALGYNWLDKMEKKKRQERSVDSESAAMLLRLYFGNPKLAVRIKLKKPAASEQQEPLRAAAGGENKGGVTMTGSLEQEKM